MAEKRKPQKLDLPSVYILVKVYARIHVYIVYIAVGG